MGLPRGRKREWADIKTDEGLARGIYRHVGAGMCAESAAGTDEMRGMSLENGDRMLIVIIVARGQVGPAKTSILLT